jgi:hypothetical protein
LFASLIFLSSSVIVLKGELAIEAFGAGGTGKGGGGTKTGAAQM